MTTDRIVATLSKAVLALADATTKVGSAPSDAPPQTATEPSSDIRVADAHALLEPGRGDVHEHLFASPQVGTMALGLPPPTLGPLPATTLAIGVALQVIVDRLPTKSDDKTDNGPQTKDPVVTTALDVQSTGEVRETQFVRGVPKTTNVVATDDRPKQRVDDGSLAQTDAANRHLEKDQSDLQAVRSEMDVFARAPEPADLAPPQLHVIPEATMSMAVALRSGSDDAFQKSGILPSAILNAAMLPGWPPPRLLEGPQARAVGDQEAVIAEREAAIAALLEMLGIDPRTLSETKANRKSSWLWLHRVLVVVAAVMAVAETLAAEIGDMCEEEEAIADGRSDRRNDGRVSKRIYLE